MSALFVVASVAGCATDERSESASTTQSGDGVETRALPRMQPQIQALRPLREAAGAKLPQLYDLAITAIGSALRGEQRSGAWYTLLDTTLRNNGNQAIL